MKKIVSVLIFMTVKLQEFSREEDYIICKSNKSWNTGRKFIYEQYVNGEVKEDCHTAGHLHPFTVESQQE